jgi:hypothetical protein
VFKYAPRGGPVALSLKFKKSGVERQEVIEALESILDALKREKG